MSLIFNALALVLFATSATADPDRVSVLVGSHHIGAAGQFEEFNPGVFLTWEGDRIDWTVGAYHNSYGRDSVAVTAALPVWSWDGGEAALFAGLAHYPVDGRRFAVHLGNDIVPLAGLQVRHGNLFAQVIPMDGKPVAAVVSFGVTFEFAR